MLAAITAAASTTPHTPDNGRINMDLSSTALPGAPGPAASVPAILVNPPNLVNQRCVRDSIGEGTSSDAARNSGLKSSSN
jgi:hypothetical protein